MSAAVAVTECHEYLERKGHSRLKSIHLLAQVISLAGTRDSVSFGNGSVMKWMVKEMKTTEALS